MASKNFELLLFIAKHNGLAGQFVSSTSKIAAQTGLSQQSVSRKLRELSAQHQILLESNPNGVKAKILEKGKKILLEQFAELSGLFSKDKAKKILGTVQSGLGEGKYYLSFEQYRSQIKEKLGFDPFVGTLNLRVDQTELSHFKSGLEEIYIDGFATKERTFGGLKAFAVKINAKENGAMIFPDRSTLPSGTAELIAPGSLRKKFGLKDGDNVLVEAQK